MRISKVIPVKASIDSVSEDSKYSTAISNIRSAIDALGEIAKDDDLARDSIANLSVVLLDLSSDDSPEVDETNED